MANKKFLDLTGTGYLWSKIKQQLDNKADSSDLTTLAGRVTAAEGEIDDLQALHASGKTVAQEVSDGISALDLANTYAGIAYEDKVDTLIIGGGMAYTFLSVQGHKIGKSLVEADYLDTARDFLKAAAEKKVNVILIKILFK